MLTLLLLRHAKSSWDNPALADFDRPLAKRGKKAAPEIGAALAAKGLRPDLVLCSSAVRARETLELVLNALGPPAPEVRYDEELYMATPATLIARLRKHVANPASAQHVMLVGHNPGFEELARLLVGSGGAEDRALLAEKFPTCAVAVIAFDAGNWSAVEAGAGRLACFLTPKHLA
jgi:phosphohistidine phosphatase